MSEESKEITKAEAGVLRKELQQATAESDQAWWKQCTLMHQVYYSGIGDELKPVYELWGYKTWHDYVENELGIHVGTASSMVSTAHFFLVRMKGAFRVKEHLLSRQRMRALAARRDKVTAANLNNWITQARNMTVCALEHKLEGRHGHGTKKVTFELSEFDHKLLKEAIDQLMATGEYDTRGQALLSVLRPGTRARKSA
jgi:hypothetical protein